MSFTDIAPLRSALRVIPSSLINTNQRVLLLLVASWPNGCFIGRHNLVLESGMKLSTLKSSLNWLMNLGVITGDVTYPRKGRQQCYRVSMTKVAELVRGYSDSPIDDVSGDVEQGKGLPEQPIEVIPITAYKDYKYNKTTQADEFSEIILRAVPNDKRFAITQSMRDLVAQVRHQGTSLTAIEQALTSVGWSEVHNAQGLVTSKLKDLLAREPDWGGHNRPTWCGHCNELTRKLDHRVDIPRQNGATTDQCLECNPYMMKYKNN